MATTRERVDGLHFKRFLPRPKRKGDVPASTVVLGLLLLLVGVIGQSGCRSSEPRPTPPVSAPGASEATVTRPLPGLGVKMEIPEQARIVTPVPNAVQVELRPGARATRTLSFTKREATAKVEPPGDRVLPLPGGLSLRYRVTQAQSDGSGGARLLLTGQLSTPGGAITVACDDQAEWPLQPSLDWCLKLLSTLSSA